MSAFVVDKEHINAIIKAGLRYGTKYGSNFHWYPKGKTVQTLTLDTADQTGQMLLDENIKSVTARYEDSEITNLPGRTDCEYLIPYQYHEPHRCPTKIEAIKAINCLDYQSCEHKAWKESESYCFLSDLKDFLVSDLDGYENAPWEWHPVATPIHS